MRKNQLFFLLIFYSSCVFGQSGYLGGSTIWNWTAGDPINIYSANPASQNIKTQTNSQIVFWVKFTDIDLTKCPDGDLPAGDYPRQHVEAKYEIQFSSPTPGVLFVKRSTSPPVLGSNPMVVPIYNKSPSSLGTAKK